MDTFEITATDELRNCTDAQIAGMQTASLQTYLHTLRLDWNRAQFERLQRPIERQIARVVDVLAPRGGI